MDQYGDQVNDEVDHCNRNQHLTQVIPLDCIYYVIIREAQQNVICQKDKAFIEYVANVGDSRVMNLMLQEET